MSDHDFMFGDRVRHLVTQELLVVWSTDQTPRGLIVVRTRDSKTKRVHPRNLVHARFDRGWDQEPAEPVQGDAKLRENSGDVETSHEPAEPVHWAGEPGEGPTSLHGNGASSFARTSGDEDDVTCKLCLTLLARGSDDPSSTCAKCGVMVTGQTPSAFYSAHDERCGGDLSEPGE